MQVPINPYGKAKKMAEDMILDFSKRSNMAVMILRFVTITWCTSSLVNLAITSKLFQVFQCHWIGSGGKIR